MTVVEDGQDGLLQQTVRSQLLVGDQGSTSDCLPTSRNSSRMNLTDLSSHCFANVIRARGDSYAQSGRVTDIACDGPHVDAVVRGSERKGYAVFLDFLECVVDGTVVASCTCPHFEGGDLCKHIWAVVRCMDDSDVEFNWPIPDALFFEPDYGEDDLEEADPWEDKQPRGKPYGTQTPQQRCAAAATTLLWQQQLQLVGLTTSTDHSRMRSIWDHSSPACFSTSAVVLSVRSSRSRVRSSNSSRVT